MSMLKTVSRDRQPQSTILTMVFFCCQNPRNQAVHDPGGLILYHKEVLI